MANYRHDLPQMNAKFLAYAGMETDLIFSKGIDLPGFASYPLLETEEGRAILKGYFRDLIEVARAAGVGTILEGPTWVANRDRGAAIGYEVDQLRELNIQAVALMAEARREFGDLPTVLSANIGPRDDAYAPRDRMSAQEAEVYHAEQMAALAETDVDLISGYTIAYPAEAIGIVRAARRFNLPVIISFTIETNGHLPTDASLGSAIVEVDAETENYASYFMINCAHPDHFTSSLSSEPWMDRLKGIVANASRCSHAELDDAKELDAGDPIELGNQLAAFSKKFPQINVLGGCCGTDMRHMSRIAEGISNT